jgi:hypothetical protein
MRVGSIRWNALLCCACGTGYKAIGALLVSIFANKQAKRDLLALTGEKAERMLQLLQLVSPLLVACISGRSRLAVDLQAPRQRAAQKSDAASSEAVDCQWYPSQ